MNILPKKSWHVRNKDNVARVRRDEAKALEEEQECARRRALAEQEARIRILREKVKQSQKEKKEQEWDLPQEPTVSTAASSDDDEATPKTEEYIPLNTAFPDDQHINLFEDFEKKKKAQGSNKEYEKEKKKMQEDYEKKIGYLTYLGQSASEMTKQKPWYEQDPKSKKDVSSVTYSQFETLQASDPLLSMKDYLDEKRRLETACYKWDGALASPSSSTTTGTPNLSHRRKRSAVYLDSTSDVKSEKLSKTSDIGSHTSSKDHKHKKSKKSKKHKKGKHRSPSSEREKTPTKPSIEDLRAARVAREAAERQRSLDLVAKYRGVSSPARSVIDERNLTYNSVYSHLPNKHKTHR